jgi:uncharacterized protein YerC
MENHYVYIIEIDGYCKVGIANNLKFRLNSYNSSSPHNVKLIKTFITTSKMDSALIEKNIHNKLKSFNLHHKLEWFIKGSLEQAILIADEEYKQYLLDDNLILNNEIYNSELKKVINLLSDITTNKVSEETGLNKRTINRIKNGKTFLNKSTFKLLTDYFKAKNHG